jgi:uncharacterized protein YxeA
MKKSLLTILALALFIFLGGWTFSHWNHPDHMTASNFQIGTVVVLFGFIASLEVIWNPK